MIFFTLTCVMVCGAVAFGQATSGTISGTMLDPQGNVLAGATVKVKNLGTGATREVTSSSNGTYRVTGLAPGRYEVEAGAQGFSPEKRGELSLTVAEEIVVNFSLKVGVTKQELTVEVQSVNVETTGSTLSGLVDERKIRDLPLNGRDLSQLILLQPGVVNSRSSQQTANTGRGLRFSVGGARPSQNLFQLDGTIINDALNNTPGSSQGLLVGVETVKEFRVLTNTYSAEYGRVAGGVFVAVTKSGTNEFHGSVFDFLRNDNMDARNFFDRCTTSVTCNGGGKPEFRRNQFGGAIGGPIVQNKTFFFFSYEGLREFKGITTISTVPDNNARLGILPTGTVTVNPQAQPLINLFPMANGANLGSGTAQFIGVTNRTARDDFATVKIDHQLSSSDSLSARYLFDDSNQILPRFFPAFPNQALNRKQVATIEERKFIGANIVNEARVGFNRSTPRELVIIPSGGVSLIAGQPTGEVNVTGLSPVGTDRTNPKLFFENNFQVSDNLFFTLGRQNIRVGAIFERFQFNGRSESRTRGRLRFSSLSDLLQFRNLDLEGSSQGSDFVRGFRQNLFGAFFQDDFKLTPRLTLNLGVRYEFVTSPTEVNGKTANLVNIVGTSNNPIDLNVGGKFFDTPKGGIGPRVGFAYDVFGDGKTALRGGFGIFYEQPLFSSYRQAAYGTLPFIQTARLRRGTAPTSLPVPGAAFGAGTPLTETLAFDLQEIYTMQYNLNVQREFLGAVLSAAYVGSRGVNLLGQGDLNTAVGVVQPDGRVFYPAGSTRRNPNFDVIRSGIQGFNSWYNSMNLGAARRFKQGLQFQLSYTFGKSIDERSGIAGRQEFLNGQSRTLDPYNRALDKARSDFDVRHSFVANATYDLPFGKLVGGDIAKYALDGWQINSIVTVSSGVPFGVTTFGDPDRDATDENAARPDLVLGANLYPVGGSSPDLWFNPAAFAPPTLGFRGTAGRNILVGPNFRSVDLGLTKLFRVNEKRSLQFRVEAFNLFNRPNFDLPANSDDGSLIFTDLNFTRDPNAGRIFQTVPLQQGDAREFQLALKFIF
jgi:hypothetical protein